MRYPDPDSLAEAITVRHGQLSGSDTLWTGSGWLFAVLAWNDDPAALAVLDLYDGGSALGDPLGRLYVPAQAHATLNLPRPGWPLDGGLTVDVGTGQASLTALIGVNRR